MIYIYKGIDINYVIQILFRYIIYSSFFLFFTCKKVCNSSINYDEKSKIFDAQNVKKVNVDKKTPCKESDCTINTDAAKFPKGEVVEVKLCNVGGKKNLHIDTLGDIKNAKKIIKKPSKDLCCKVNNLLKKAILDTKNTDGKSVVMYDGKRYKLKNINYSGSQSTIYVLNNLDGEEDIIIKLFRYSERFNFKKINILKNIIGEFKFHKSLKQNQKAQYNSVWCKIGYFQQLPFLIKKAASYTLKEILSKCRFTKKHAESLKDFLGNISQDKHAYLDMHANNIMYDEKIHNFVLVDSKMPKQTNSVDKAHKANIENFKKYINYTGKYDLRRFFFCILKGIQKWRYQYKDDNNRLVMKQLLKDLDKILQKLK